MPEGLDLTFEVRSKNFLEEKSKKQEKYKGGTPFPLPAPTRALANTEPY